MPSPKRAPRYAWLGWDGLFCELFITSKSMRDCANVHRYELVRADPPPPRRRRRGK
jgi:hypothetical protein